MTARKKKRVCGEPGKKPVYNVASNELSKHLN